MHLKLSGEIVQRKLLLPREFFMDFNTGALKSPFLGFWILASSSHEALQIGGSFHQGQFPYCSGYEVRRVQHSRFQLGKLFYY